MSSAHAWALFWWRKEAIASRRVGSFDRAQFCEEQARLVEAGRPLHQFKGIL